MKFIREIFINLISFALIILFFVGTICFYQYMIQNNITFLDLGIIVIKIAILSVIIYLTAIVLYKLILEKFHMKYERKKTIEITTTRFGNSLLISGARGGGKDTLTTAIVRQMAILFRNKVIDKLLNIRQQAYIFDFDKFDKFLTSKEAKNLLLDLSNRQRKKALKPYFKQYKGFLKANYFLDKRNPHYTKIVTRYSEDKRSGFDYYTKVRNYDFFDLFNSYMKYFVRLVHVNKFIISNSPVLETKEDLDLKHIPGFKLSYDFFKIKEFNKYFASPYMIYYDTEGTVYYNNAAKSQENKNKEKNGTLENQVMKRHLDESFFYVSTAQNKDRTQLWWRELMDTNIELQEKFKIVCTKKIRRTIIQFRVSVLFEFYRSLFAADNNFILWLDKKTYKLKQKHDRYINEGYIRFNAVTIRKDGDIIQKKRLSSILRNDSVKNFKCTYTFKILDTWPYYDTEYFGYLQDDLVERSEVKISELEGWTEDMSFTAEDAMYQNHDFTNEMLKSETPDQYLKELKKIPIEELRNLPDYIKDIKKLLKK